MNVAVYVLATEGQRAYMVYVHPRSGEAPPTASRTKPRHVPALAGAIKKDPPPSRLLELSLTVDDYLAIEKKYTKKGWGLRQVVELEVRQRASPAPAQIGQLFALVDKKGLFPLIDKSRKVAKGGSTLELNRIVERRNLIAHTGDRSGRGRATISVAEVEADLAIVVEIIDALDQLTKD